MPTLADILSILTLVVILVWGRNSSAGKVEVGKGKRTMIGDGFTRWGPVLDQVRGLVEVLVAAFIHLTRKRRHAMPRRPRKKSGRDWQAFLLPVRGGHAHLVHKKGFGITLWAFNREGVVVPWWPDCSWYGDMQMVKRRTPREGGQPVAHLAPMESNILAKYQPLVAHCAATMYDDGSTRKPGWFTVRTRGSAWEIEIKDPETASRLVVIQQDLDDCIQLAATLLSADDAPWEHDPWLSQQNARQKKKSST